MKEEQKDLQPFNQNLNPIPLERIESKFEDKRYQYFSEDEIKLILNFIQAQFKNQERGTKTHRKYYLLINILLYTGIRISECLALSPASFDFTNDLIQVVNLKAHKKVRSYYIPDKNTGLFMKVEKPVKSNKPAYRTVPLNKRLKEVVLQYFLDYNINKKSQEPLFPYTRQSVNKYFDKLSVAMGHKKGWIRPHKFRHTFAIRALRSGVSVNALQQILGHTSLNTTTVYTKITAIDLQSEMSKFIEY